MNIIRAAAAKRQVTLLHVAIWSAAALVGVVAVLYAKLVAWSQGLYFREFDAHPIGVTLATPLLFVAAAALVRHLAQEAKGSGIPQVLEAIELAHEPRAKDDLGAREIWAHRLVSIRTAAVKVVSSTLGIFGGASIGREGPTVQIAASGFAWIGNRVRRWVPDADFPSFLTAGAAAGVAAAFNTPLAGVTFAIEEVAEGSFGPFRELVILGVVIAGITAQGLAGDYLYFGRPTLHEIPYPELIACALAIGITGGAVGGLFARLLANPGKLPMPRRWWMRAFVLGIVCAAVGYLTQGKTAGSGYEVTRESLEAIGSTNPGLGFPILKFVTTAASYLSGMAGGIFSPCLSIGAGIGFTFAALTHVTIVKSCALLGMVAFFSGVVQAPLTAVVIVMEMTDKHALILPFMAAAFLAQAIGRLLMPVPLYRYLANKSVDANKS